VKSTSIFFYKDAVTRAADANPVSDRMFSSESYQGMVTKVEESLITGITYYTGEKETSSPTIPIIPSSASAIP